MTNCNKLNVPLISLKNEENTVFGENREEMTAFISRTFKNLNCNYKWIKIDDVIL